MRNKYFEKLCKKTQEELKTYLAEELTRRGREVVSDKGFLYSKGELPIMICAHLDTVHKHVPSIIRNKDGKVSSPYGIGGDDRCGVYMILKIIERLNPKLNPYVLFLEDEEIGCHGAGDFVYSPEFDELYENINYIIELDRKGKNDAVFYDCDNKECTDFITENFWEKDYGIFTDISILCPALGCAGVNLSCGYYNPHKEDEYVVLDEMETAISEVIKLIERSDPNKFYKYIRSYNTYDEYDEEDNSDYLIAYEIVFYDEDGNESVCEVAARSEEEALGYFMIEHPSMCYNDIVEIA